MPDDFRRTRTILIIESSLEVREGLAVLLNGYGYEVKESRDMASGMASFKEGGVDMVLLEMSPASQAREELELLRSAPAGEEVTVVALVNTTDVAGVASWLDAGCDDFLLKPVSPRLLFQRVQSLLESNPRAYNRVDCHVVAELTTGTQQETGTLKEVGEGGAGMLIDEELPTGDIVKITFPLPGHSEDLVVGAEVIYIQETEGQYLHGLRFIIIDTVTREKIREYVQGMLKTKS